MTTLTTSIASFRNAAHLDARQPLRYQVLGEHHARIEHRLRPTKTSEAAARPVQHNFRRSARLSVSCR